MGNCLLSEKDLKKTIREKIINTYPYNETYLFSYGYKNVHIKNLKWSIELLDFYYEKYGVKEFKKNDKNVLIEIKI